MEQIIILLQKLPFLKKSPLAPYYFIEIIIGFSLALLSILIFDEIADHVYAEKTHAIDIFLSQSIYHIRTPWLTEIMKGISFLGAEFTLIIASLGIILLAIIHRKREAVFFTGVLLLGALLNHVLKILYQRPRPDIDPLISLSSFSFPSAHAMNAFIFYAVVSYFVFHITKRTLLSVVVVAIAISIILLVGFSRIYLGVHYPSDVLAGYFAGFCIFVSAILFKHTNSFFHLHKKKN